MVSIHRIGNQPIIHQGMSSSIGNGINGPSLVARPEWAPGPGRYLLYFAHHYGTFIRLAFADTLQGPWKIHEQGVLPLATTPFAQTRPDLPLPDWAIEWEIDAYRPHIASPDVHVNHVARCFDMLFHGLADDGEQKTYLATSVDGIEWQVQGPSTQQTYLRRFTVAATDYAIALGGQLLRAADTGRFALGHWPLPENTRHVSVLKRGKDLHVLFTKIWDTPERMFHCVLDISDDWAMWRMRGEPQEVLAPTLDWEGASLPVSQSRPGETPFAHALRDPAMFEEHGRLWLVYAGGGESALGLAEITRI